MEKLLEILKEAKPNVDFENEKALVSGGILDSLDIVTIISMLCDEFGCELDLSDLVAEKFDSLEAIYETVENNR